MIPAALLAAALAMSLFVDSTFHNGLILIFVFCIVSFALGAKRHCPAMTLWIAVIVASGLLLAKLSHPSGVVMMGVMLLLPCVALTATRQAAIACSTVIAVFAANHVWQKLFWPDSRFTFCCPARAAWPLLNPNNAAAIINLALLPAIGWFDRKKTLLRLLPVLLFAAALWATQSRGGLMGAGIGTAAYVAIMYPRMRPALAAPVLILAGMLVMSEPARLSVLSRFPIWETAWPLVSLKGSGIGTFYQIYAPVKAAADTSMGMFAHNDLLQIAIEMGWPAALVFIGITVYIAARTNRANAVHACAMLAVLAQSFVCFAFYLAPVSLLMGVRMSLWLNSQTQRS